MKRKKTAFVLLLAAALIFTFRLTGIYYPLRTYLLMYPLSRYYKNTGLFRDIPLGIPAGKLPGVGSFIPFMLYFNADESHFARWMGYEGDLTLSIIYNFGGFCYGRSYADYFDPAAGLYSAFYGAYAVNNKDLFFTADGSIRLSQLALVPHYDQKYLVLPAIGLPSKEVIFQAESIELEENVTYLNIPGWYKMVAEIYTNMPAHRYRTRQLGYLQYGSPKGLENVTEDYRAERLCARAYCRFFEEYNATVVLYIMAKNKDIAEQIDREILSRSVFGP